MTKKGYINIYKSKALDTFKNNINLKHVKLT